MKKYTENLTVREGIPWQELSGVIEKPTAINRTERTAVSAASKVYLQFQVPSLLG